MEQHIEPRVVLLAAEKIHQQGIAQDGKHVFQQMAMEVAHDGYTVTVSDPKVKLSILFHNRVLADYQRIQDLESFYQKLCKLAES